MTTSATQQLNEIKVQDSFGFKGGRGTVDGWESNGYQTTEWEDALVKHKVISKRQRVKTVDQLNNEWRNEQAKIDVLEQKTLEELDDMEDELEENTLAKYRARRMEEFKQAQNSSKFGVIKNISEPQYKSEVSQGSQGTWVVCCLYIFGNETNRYMLQCLANVARRHSDIKFCKIIAQECIHGYPDKFTPTIILYNDCELKGHIKGTYQFGGSNMTADFLEWELANLGVFKTDQDVDPRKRIAKLTQMGKKHIQTRNYDSDESDSLDL